MRDVNRYKVVNNLLRWDLWQRPERQAPPFSRPVIDSGTAFKEVYLSKAPAHFTPEQLNKALENHITRMRNELQADGRMVTNIIKTLSGQDGDVRVQMYWQVLGAKRTKHYRRIHGKLKANEGALEPVEGSATEPGRAATQTSVPEGGVPL